MLKIGFSLIGTTYSLPDDSFPSIQKAEFQNTAQKCQISATTDTQHSHKRLRRQCSKCSKYACDFHAAVLCEQCYASLQSQWTLLTISILVLSLSFIANNILAFVNNDTNSCHIICDKKHLFKLNYFLEVMLWHPWIFYSIFSPSSVIQ